MNCITFEKTLKQYQFSILELRIYFKHLSWHGETCGNKSGFSWYFLPTQMTNWEHNFHRFVVLYISWDTQSVGLGKYCLPKVYNGFNIMFMQSSSDESLGEDSNKASNNVLDNSMINLKFEPMLDSLMMNVWIWDLSDYLERTTHLSCWSAPEGDWK